MTLTQVQPRGQDGVQIVDGSVTRPDAIATAGVESQMLLASESLFLKREVISPGAVALRHYHATASMIAILEGRVRVNYGRVFQHTDYVEAGEFILIPALMPHQPVNEDPDRHAVCLVVRNAPWDELMLFDQGAAADAAA